MKESVKHLFLGSAVMTAIAASLCCVLPVLSVALGLGAFGVASIFETLRPYFLVAAFFAPESFIVPANFLPPLMMNLIIYWILNRQ